MKNFLQISQELGWPKIYLVSDQQFRAIEGEGLYKDKHNKRWEDTYDGASGEEAPIISLRHNLRGKALRNTIYHEILHRLYWWRRHWWIECAAEILANGGGRGYYSKKYNHKPEDINKTREELLEQVRRQVKRFNQK